MEAVGDQSVTSVVGMEVGMTIVCVSSFSIILKLFIGRLLFVPMVCADYVVDEYLH